MSLSDDDIIDRFLKGELSEEAAKDFQNRLESDHELVDRLKLEKQLFESLNEEDWSTLDNADHPEVAAYRALFADEESAEIKKAIAISQETYKAGGKETPVKKLNNWWTYSAAAVLLVLASVLILFPRKNSPESLYMSYLARTELPSVVNRGKEEADNLLADGQRLFEEKEYEQAIEILKRVPEQDRIGAYYIYLSLGLAEVEKYEEALTTIDGLIESNLLDSVKGYWFKSLIYLRANELNKAKEQLRFIIENGYFNNELASALLEEF